MRKFYVFVTYGSLRIRGVQTKAVRISSLLPKDEVLIINHGDSSWLKITGAQIYETNFNSIESSETMDPKLKDILSEAKAVIFCDFPTNMIFSSTIFWYVYSKTNTPLCVCDNIYSNDQFENKIYKIFYKLSDLTLLTGLGMFTEYLSQFPKAKLIPPFFPPFNFGRQYYRELLDSAWKINPNQKIVLYVAYNMKVFEISKQISQNLNSPDIYHIIIIPPNINNAEKEKLKKTKNLTVIEREIGYIEMRDLMAGSDIIVCKFGYQQLIESLSLGKPTITIGDSGLGKYWLDKKLQDVFEFFPEYSEKIIDLIKKLIQDNEFYAKTTEKISLTHTGKFDGAVVAAEAVKKLAEKLIPQRLKLSSNVLFAFNTKENIVKAREIIQKELFILPIIISNKFAERDFGYGKENNPLISDLTQFNFAKKLEYLNSSSFLLFEFSEIAYHGIGPLLPHLNLLTMAIEKLMISSEKIFLIGDEANTFFSQMISRNSLQNKVVSL